MYLAGVGAAAAMLPPIPVWGHSISPEAMLDVIDPALKKRIADVALNAARAKGATYTDVRIGRYLNQFVVTREDKVQNIVNTESYGMGVRVIANGSWGFAATDKMDNDGIAKAAELAVAIAKENSKLLTSPVEMAPQTGYGEVSWKAPIEKNAFEIPIKEKVDLLLSVNDAAMKGGANYANSILFLVNEQKYFASTDGSYIDQDVHRIWPTFFLTKIDSKTGKFETRNALSAPSGMGYEYLQARPQDKIQGVTTFYKGRYDMLEDAKAAASQLGQKLTAKSVEPGNMTWYSILRTFGLPFMNLLVTLQSLIGYWVMRRTSPEPVFLPLTNGNLRNLTSEARWLTSWLIKHSKAHWER